ncbi:MAG TPA: hypothetical protein PLQ04_06635 [Lachnospiraceae bacterium]|nr:hypothetical protein [Lachnospiraceae bacterium]
MEKKPEIIVTIPARDNPLIIEKNQELEAGRESIILCWEAVNS